jgi:hypothetical protein
MINTEGSHAALLDWPWKLHTDPRAGNGKKKQADVGTVEPVMLFDLQTDPRETTNLASAEPERVAKMVSALLEWKRSVKRSLTGADYPAAGGR